MAKTCIFCGNETKEKSREHVLPQWLIKLTGDPNRKVYLGVDRVKSDFKKEIYVYREYGINDFHFPACIKCNNSFSLLEDKAKEVVSKILDSNPIQGGEMSLLLDWFDKVRVGLWLGYNQLNKNPIKNKKNYYTAERIGTSDRVLYIFKAEGHLQRLSFWGMDDLVSAFLPSCFILAINDLFFINVSFISLISKNLGFPYRNDLRYSDILTKTNLFLSPGREEILCPFLGIKTNLNGIEIFQPMFTTEIYNHYYNLYNIDYVKKHCMNVGKGIGNIFIPNMYGGHSEYSSGDFIKYEFMELYHEKYLEMEMQKLLYKIRLLLLKEHAPSGANPLIRKLIQMGIEESEDNYIRLLKLNNSY
jgi:hypothetical protein